MGKSIVVGQKERVGAWVAERVDLQAPWVNFEAMGLELNGELIAGVVFDSYVKDARCCMHVAGLRGTWLNRPFLRAAFDYAFGKMGCKVVIGLVNADNDAALRFDRHLGFEEVARIKDGAGDCDLLVLAMRREQCRWLTLREQRDEALA
ncbi:GP68 protein [Hydrogenophaga intermedia]|uniref:GP68 protein n=1 Tax=Hydrogenophaga intermedia TaxID=65786 RepID=A0A1L1PRU1_HYDIT|nr:GNAT family protein [Hydrogenophaga intermedia]CDN87311.1 GP68 protein [Hydrogenophaga intermedia]